MYNFKALGVYFILSRLRDCSSIKYALQYVTIKEERGYNSHDFVQAYVFMRSSCAELCREFTYEIRVLYCLFKRRKSRRELLLVAVYQNNNKLNCTIDSTDSFETIICFFASVYTDRLISCSRPHCSGPLYKRLKFVSFMQFNCYKQMNTSRK